MPTKSQHRIEYTSPSAKTIRALAREVCEHLAAETENETYIQPQSVRWLAEFMELAVRVKAKRLNDDKLVDSSST